MIDPDKIGGVIGTGGKTIRSIIDETKTTIDISNDGTVTIITSDQAHSYPGYGSLYRYAGIHQGQAAGTNTGHRGAAVGAQDFGNKANSIRKILIFR